MSVGIERGPVLLEVGDAQVVGAKHLAGARRVVTRQHPQQRRLAATVRPEQCQPRARADEQAHLVEHPALAEVLADGARLDQPFAAGVAGLARLKVEIDAAHPIARGKPRHLARQRPRPFDARVLFGAARGRATPEPLGFAPQRIAEGLLALLLRRHALGLLLEVGGVVPRHVQQSAFVPAVELQNPIGDPLQEQAVVGDGQGRKASAREQALQPEDAFDVEMIRRLVQQQQLGVTHQRAGECHPLLPPAGQLVDRPIRIQVEAIDPLVDHALAFVTGAL